MRVRLAQAFPTAGLPNMVNYNLGPLLGSECDTLTIDTTININTNIDLNEILIYPNPFVSEITLQSNNSEELIYSIKKIEGKEILNGSFVKIKSVYLNNLAAGVYLIEITNNKGALLKSQKIIKN